MSVTIKQVIMTENRCNKRGERITPRGIVVHSTASNNPELRRYVQPDPDGTIGKNDYGNHWNQATADKCMHGFLGLLLDGTVAFAQNLPWDYRCWGCGGGDSGSYNDSHIQFEICEDGLDDPEYYWAVFDAAAELCAMLCRQYGIRTVNIVSHKEAAAALYASKHVDPAHWMDNFGDSMDAFRARVAALIGEDDTVRPTWDEMRRDTLRKGAKSAHVAELQGILLSLGYDVGKSGADGVYGSATQKAVKAFQADNELTPDGVAGPNTWQTALRLIAAIEGEDKPQEAPDGPQEPADTWDTLTIEEKVEDLNGRPKQQEGGGVMVMDLGNLIAAGGLLVAALSLAVALRKDTRGDARSQGEQMAMLTSISNGVDDIRLEQRRMRDRADQQAKELAECMSSCRSAHKRIDEHERRLNQLQTHPPD